MAIHTGKGRGPGHMNRKSQGSGGAAPPASPSTNFSIPANSQYVPIFSAT